jgi:hypothetical protein
MSSRTDRLCCLALLLLGGALAALTWRARAGTALVHDELAYLFQARTLLAGRLSFPSPPLPAFFEVPHVLVVPVYSAKYFPGHALALAPWLAAGAPWLWSCASLGLAAALCYATLRWSGARAPAALAGALLLLGSGTSLKSWATYLSHGTSALCAASAFALAARARGGAAAGAVAGFALLTRPFVGVALAASCALPLRGRKLAAYACALLVAACAALLYCRAITGDALLTPWSLYARQYAPVDGPGVGPVRAAAPERALPVHLQPMADGFFRSRSAYTWAALPGVARHRLEQLLFDYPPSVVALPFLAVGLIALPWALAPPLCFAVLLFLLQLGFHAANSFYLLEAWPALALITGWGVERTLRALGSGWLRLALLAPAAIAAWSALGEVRGVQDYGSTQALRLQRIERALEPARRARGLVFLRYPPGWNTNVDLTYGEPDLSRAQLVRAIDLGPRNDELRRRFPDRPAFLFDLETEKLQRLSETPR